LVKDTVTEHIVEVSCTAETTN